jgi:hypothetical protein
MGTIATSGQTPSSTEPAAAWVQEVLEPEQLSAAKPRYGRHQLSRGTLWLLWGLRVYVFLMIILIAVQIWRELHG